MAALNASVPWLINIARRASLVGIEQVRPDVKVALDDSWTAVAQACGITQDELVIYVASAFRLKVADFRTAQARALKLIPEKLVRSHMICPLREDDKILFVATSDPTDPDVEQTIGFASGRRPQFEVASPPTLKVAIESRYAADEMVDALLRTIDADTIDNVTIADEAAAGSMKAEDADAARIRRLTNLILQEGVRQQASHIHLEPGGAGAIVRYRVDGMLRSPAMQLPMLALGRVVARLRTIAGMQSTDRFDTKEGRARVRVGGQSYDLLISTAATRDADRAVVRVIDPQATLWLQDISIAGPELARLRRLLKCRDGLVVVSAPPASGATTTAYAMLRELADEGRSIVTVEDPVEYELPGMTQLAVDFSRRGSFIAAMTEVAQRNPAVVYVSDVRDADAARVLVETAAAGRLVIVTMHAHTAVGVIDRLTKLGVDSARLAQVLRGTIALSLLRRVCRECVDHNATPPTVEESRLAGHYGAGQKVRAAGCLRCAKTGYKGRLPIAEVLVTTSALVAKIAAGASAEDLQMEAVAGGMRSLRQAALERVSAGETTLQEIDRVLGDEAADPRAPVSRPHILVVDDDGVTRMYARQLLENSGYTVSEATDGVVGLEHIAAAEDLALVVLDIEMPHLGGRDVLASIRRSVATHALPVVVLTGLEGEGTEAQLMELGADDYLHKPIDPARFAARISAVLRRAGG